MSEATIDYLLTELNIDIDDDGEDNTSGNDSSPPSDAEINLLEELFEV